MTVSGSLPRRLPVTLLRLGLRLSAAATAVRVHHDEPASDSDGSPWSKWSAGHSDSDGLTAAQAGGPGSDSRSRAAGDTDGGESGQLDSDSSLEVQQWNLTRITGTT